MFSVEINNRSVNFTRFWLQEELKGYAKFEIILDGQDSGQRGTFQKGDLVEIWEDGGQIFEGEITKTDNLEGSAFLIKGIGVEVDFLREPSITASNSNKKVYTGTDDNTIFQDLVGNVSNWNADVSNSSATSVSSFKVHENDSTWNSIMRLIQTTGKDIKVIRITGGAGGTRTIELRDRKGENNKFEFEEGKTISNIKLEKSQPINQIKVYGKGEGDGQIVGSDGSGTPIRRITDPLIISQAEADQRASTQKAKYDQENKYYSFILEQLETNPNASVSSLETGDRGKLDTATVEKIFADVDIVRMVKSVNSLGNQNVYIQVTNQELREPIGTQQTSIDSLSGGLVRSNSSDQPKNQTHEWNESDQVQTIGTELINEFNVTSDMIFDEAGNYSPPINFTLDYNVYGYKRPANKGWNFLGSDSNTDQAGQGSYTFLSVTHSGDPYHAYLIAYNVSLDDQPPTTNPFDARVEVTQGLGGVVYTRSQRFQNQDMTDVTGDWSNTDFSFTGSSSDYILFRGWVQCIPNPVNSPQFQVGVYNDNVSSSTDITYEMALYGYSLDGGQINTQTLSSSTATVELQYFSGGTWSTVNTITLPTNAATFSGNGDGENGVDLSAGGTYPNQAGQWRIRMYPNSSLVQPDYYKTTVNLKEST